MSRLRADRLEQVGRQAPITMAEAISLTKQVLRTGRHVSAAAALPQKELRPRITFLDPRAARFSGDPASETLISDIVDAGLQVGWLKRFRRNRTKTGTEMIYLAELPEAETVAQDAAHRMPEADRPGREDMVQRAPVSRGSSEEAPREGLSEGTTGNAAGSSAEARKKKHPNRATDFEALLSKSRIGSMPETRDYLFDAVEELVSQNRTELLPILELFKRAVDRARERSAKENYATEQNWPVARMCNQRLMLWAGVLVGEDGQPIADKIGSVAKRVSGLGPDFRRVCEAYLAEHIIDKTGGINYDDDLYYLGLVLYRRGKARAVAAEELKSKADSILSFLEDQGRVLLDGRTLRVKQSRTRSLAVAG